MSAREKIANVLWWSVPSSTDEEAKERAGQLLDAHAAEVRAAHDRTTAAWLLKKAAEYRAAHGLQNIDRAEVIERLADKVRRGAVRDNNLRMPSAAGQAPAPQPETTPDAEPRTPDLREGLKQAFSNAGAFCGDDCCGFQPGDRDCPNCERHWDRCADAVIAVLAEQGAES